MMNYANMIEEKSLKKTFIIATLCSTLVGTFTSSIGLWDRVKARRKQTARDLDQDDQIKKLQAQVDDAERRARDPRYRKAAARRLRDEADEYDDEYDDYDFSRSLERSGALIRREFDDGYGRLGKRFAVGDPITENRLQAQVIRLQQTVIDVLQDALYSGRQLDRHDVARLMAASDAARDQSVNALRQQQLAMIEAAEPPPRAASLPPRSSVDGRRRSSRARSPGASSSSSSTVAVSGEPQRIYCRYSLDLQYFPTQPLAASFTHDGDGGCPVCGVRLAIAPDDCWAIAKRSRARVAAPPPRKRSGTVSHSGSSSRSLSMSRSRARASTHYDDDEEDVLEEREFQFGQRFVTKCHLPDGRLACVLCNRFRSADTICLDADDLADHLGRDHDVDELEREMDFETRSRLRPLPRALPAPELR